MSGKRLLGHLAGFAEFDEWFHLQKFAQGELNCKRNVRSLRNANSRKANYNLGGELGNPEMLGERLRQWRKRAGYTLEKVAGDIGTTKGHLSDMERNTKALSSRWIEKIAETYNVPQDSIIAPSEFSALAKARLEEEERDQVITEYSELTDTARENIRSAMRLMPKRTQSKS